LVAVFVDDHVGFPSRATLATMMRGSRPETPLIRRVRWLHPGPRVHSALINPGTGWFEVRLTLEYWDDDA
jgi:hypothetical protein